MTPRSLLTTSEASNLLPFLEVKPFKLTFCPASSRRMVESVTVLPATVVQARQPHPSVAFHVPADYFSRRLVEH